MPTSLPPRDAEWLEADGLGGFSSCQVPTQALAAWRLGKGCGVRAEIVPSRASDFEEDRTTSNTLAFEAATHGVLVYGR
jgi:hypothetical protein